MFLQLSQKLVCTVNQLLVLCIDHLISRNQIVIKFNSHPSASILICYLQVKQFLPFPTAD